MALVEKKATTAAQDFEELQRAAEEAVGAPSDTEFYAEYVAPPEAETVEADPPPIVEEPVEAEPPAEEPGAEPEPEPEVEAKKEPDRFDEVNKKLGQLLNENAELRRQQDELTQQAQQQSRGPQYSADQFASIVDDDPVQATILAFQAGDQAGFHRGWQAWNEVSPGAPQIWYDNQTLRGEIGALQASLREQIAPAQQMAQRNQVEQALSVVADRHEDFAQVIGSLDADRAAEILESGFPPQILEGLGGDQQQKEKVFETLYRWVKSEQTGQLVQAAQENAGKQAEETREAKVAATVASASTTTPDPVPETEEERQRRVWAEARTPVRDAWQGQETRRR